MCIMEHLEFLEYSRIFFSNPEYEILFRNKISCAMMITEFQIAMAAHKPTSVFLKQIFKQQKIDN